MGKNSEPQNEMLKGTLDMMILRTLVGGDAHGHTIAKVIERTSEDLLDEGFRDQIAAPQWIKRNIAVQWR